MMRIVRSDYDPPSEWCRFLPSFRPGHRCFIPRGWCGVHGEPDCECEVHDRRFLAQGRRLRWMRGLTTEPLTRLSPPPRASSVVHLEDVSGPACGDKTPFRKMTIYLEEVECLRCRSTHRYRGWARRLRYKRPPPPLRLV